MSKLYIKWHESMSAKESSLNIIINGHEVCSIENGELKELDIQSGQHEIKFGKLLKGSNLLKFNAESNEPIFLEVNKGLVTGKYFQLIYAGIWIISFLLFWLNREEFNLIYFILGFTLLSFITKYLIFNKKHYKVIQSKYTPFN